MQPTPPRVAVVSDAASGLLTGTSIGMLSDAYTYNTFGETSEYSLMENGAVVFDEQYVRDDAGRITSRTETSAGTSTTIGYSYDTAGHLASVTRDGTQTTAYSYNANGGRSAKSMPGATYSATYDDQDRLLTYLGATYSYTANGELSTKTDMNGTTSYTYDALGNLRTVVLPDGKRVDYVIDGQNRRVGKKVNGTLVQGWLYADQLRIVAELDGTGTIVSQFVYGTHTNVPDYMLHGGNTYRFITDHVGSPRFLIDIGTNLVQSVDYDEFGTVLSDSNPGFQPFGFAGGLYDADTKLVRFGARDYDPSTGRWTAKDPIGFRGGWTNFFDYVGNDPINFIDPSGLQRTPAQGQPPGTQTFPNDQGGKTVRTYGPDGRATQDVDYGHDHGQGDPHVHDWDWSKKPPRQPGRATTPGEVPKGSSSCSIGRRPDGDWARRAGWTAVGVGVGVIVGTLVEDFLTGGVGILDDPLTIGAGVTMIRYGLAP